MKGLIVTADDFGAAVEVNEAVEIAHRDGVLTAASLMVAGPAVADAVARAKRLPGLRVGLHLVLVEGRPALSAAEIPDLVDANGRFRTDMVGLGVSAFLRPRVRNQLTREIEEQFLAFRHTGLVLDHVNAHKHFHLHPVVAEVVLRIGKAYGLRAIRVPSEPRAVLTRADSTTKPASAIVTGPWAIWLRRRARSAGVATAQQTFGQAWSGQMTGPRMAALARHLPPGLSEIYLHPATKGEFEGAAPGYRYAEELAGLVAPSLRDGVRSAGAQLGGFADFAYGS
jgi:hopanoid biosynthesis associated protein HpnK